MSSAKTPNKVAKKTQGKAAAPAVRAAVRAAPRAPAVVARRPTPAPRAAPAISMNSAGHGNMLRHGGDVLFEGMPVHGSALSHGHTRARALSNGVHISGCERLASVAATGGNPAGTVIARAILNPKSFGVRLPPIAEQYDKFKFTRVTLHYVPAITLVNNAASGTIYMVAGFNPLEGIPSSVDSLAAWARNKTVFPVYEHGSLKLDLQLGTQDPLFTETSGDARFGVQASLALVAGDAQPTSAALGQWFIDYEVELTNINVDTAESSNCVTVRYSGARVGEGGPELNARAVTFAGDTDVFTVPPPGSTASFLIAPGAYLVTFIMRALAPIINCNTTPMLQIFGTSNMFLTGPVCYNANNTGTTGTMTAGNVFLNQVTAPFVNGVTGDTTDYILVGHIYMATGAGGSTSSIRIAIPAAIIMPADPTWQIDMSFVRFPVSSYSVNGNTAYNTLTYRGLPNVMPTVRSYLAVENYDVDAELAPFLDEARAFVRSADPSELSYANAINECFNLGERIVVPTTVPLFAHSMAEIGLFLLKKFGPTVAAHVLGMARGKLEKWLKNHKE